MKSSSPLPFPITLQLFGFDVMLCLFTAGFQAMSIYNSPLLLVLYSLHGWRAKTPERPLVSFFSGSLKQPVYFCRLDWGAFHIEHSSVVFLMFCNSLFQSPLASLCPRFSQLREPPSPKGPHAWLPPFHSFLSQAGLCFISVSRLWFPRPDDFELIQIHSKSSGDVMSSAGLCQATEA